jgi:hypothetical protein
MMMVSDLLLLETDLLPQQRISGWVSILWEFSHHPALGREGQVRHQQTAQHS